MVADRQSTGNRLGSVARHFVHRGYRFDRLLPAITVIVPARNEAENLAHVLPGIPWWVDEVMLVDDHSTDDTVMVAKELRRDIKVVSNRRPIGKGNALRTGYEAARGVIIVQIDADGSADGAVIPKLLAALCKGADYAKGSRFLGVGELISDMARHRKLGNALLTKLANSLYPIRFTDLCCGCNAIWAYHLPELELTAEGFEIEAMLNLRAAQRGLHIVEVASLERRRIFGRSHLRAGPDGARILRTILSERRRERCAADSWPTRSSSSA